MDTTKGISLVYTQRINISVDETLHFRLTALDPKTTTQTVKKTKMGSHILDEVLYRSRPLGPVQGEDFEVFVSTRLISSVKVYLKCLKTMTSLSLSVVL